MDVTVSGLTKDLALPVADLRAFRNKFFKYCLRSSSVFSAEDLAAFLLYFALGFIDTRTSVGQLFKVNNNIANKFDELTDKEISVIGNEFLGLLKEFLPLNLRDSMVVPNISAWTKAKKFFVEYQQNPLFTDIANLGFAYQIFTSINRKDTILPALQKANKKITKEELITFTQLYTPNWVVDFLVANTFLSKSSKKKISTKYARWIMPESDNGDRNDFPDLNDFSVLDPACGAGQFLFSVFDLLMELYRQNGLESEMAARLIFKNNIFGADIDEKALWVAGLGLFCQYLTVSHSIKSLPDRLDHLAPISVDDLNGNIDDAMFLGSIDKRLLEGHFLKQRYSVLVTNPPYIGRRCLSRDLKEALRVQYPNSSADLSAAFLERCLAMLKPDGKLGIITQSSLMSIPSYASLRQHLISNFYLRAAIHCGPGVFPLATGEKIDSILLLLRSSATAIEEKLSAKTYFVDLHSIKSKSAKLADILHSSVNAGNGNDFSTAFLTNQSDFIMGIPNSLISQLSTDFRSKLNKLPRLGEIADIRQGLATTDNGRFVRYGFDIEDTLIGSTWVPYIKGAGAERYMSKNPFVIKWGENGQEIKAAVAKAYPYLEGKTAWVVKNEEFYFRPGLCFSFINKSGLAVRRLPAGAIFDVASSAIFSPPEQEDFLLAYLNSRVIGLLAKSINQTINIQVGDLKKIPIIPLDKNLKNEIGVMGKAAYEIKSQLIDCSLLLPTSSVEMLSANKLSSIIETYVNSKTLLRERLSDVQDKIDKVVIEAMEKHGFIDSREREFLQASLTEENDSKKSFGPILSERQCVYQLLNMMVSHVLSIEAGERVVLVPLIDNKNLLSAFNMTVDGLSWLEDKMGIPMIKLLSRTKILNISKLAGEPGRYFSFYLNDYRACMMFSASAVRRLKNNSKANILVLDELSLENDCINEVNLLWQRVFRKLDNIVDWTSKDLENTFKLIEKGA